MLRAAAARVESGSGRRPTPGYNVSPIASLGSVRKRQPDFRFFIFNSNFAAAKKNEDEPRNHAHSAAQHRIEHHRAADGHRLDGHSRPLGHRLGGDDRRAGHRSLDLQLHLLELLLRTHGHERSDGPGFRCGRHARMHRHAGPGALGGCGDGSADGGPWANWRCGR